MQSLFLSSLAVSPSLALARRTQGLRERGQLCLYSLLLGENHLPTPLELASLPELTPVLAYSQFKVRLGEAGCLPFHHLQQLFISCLRILTFLDQLSFFSLDGVCIETPFSTKLTQETKLPNYCQIAGQHSHIFGLRHDFHVIYDPSIGWVLPDQGENSLTQQSEYLADSRKRSLEDSITISLLLRSLASLAGLAMGTGAVVAEITLTEEEMIQGREIVDLSKDGVEVGVERLGGVRLKEELDGEAIGVLSHGSNVKFNTTDGRYDGI